MTISHNQLIRKQNISKFVWNTAQETEPIPKYCLLLDGSELPVEMFCLLFSDSIFEPISMPHKLELNRANHSSQQILKKKKFFCRKYSKLSETFDPLS